MEGEINNFILVWSLVLTSLCYCHIIGRCFPAGDIFRLLAIFPVVCLFFILPLKLTTITLGGTTSFFVAWLANFKLILFALGKGPLFTNPPLPLSGFLALACLPIKAKQFPSGKPPKAKRAHKSLVNYASKIIVLIICMNLYGYKDHFVHPKMLWLLYLVQMYISLELVLASTAALAWFLIGVELEPQFEEPYLATSLQDFWGKRWNLMVSNVLRLTVYEPVCAFCTRVAGKTSWRKWSTLPAVLLAFLVSGLMHELVFYNIGRLKPTGEVTCFFLLSGMSVMVEIGIKRFTDGKPLLPGILTRIFTLMFLILTSFWLFFPPLLRGKADWKGCTEILALIEFVKSGRIVSSSIVSCPFL